MLRELRVPMLRAPATATARPTRRPLLKAAAALFRQGADAVLYGYLAVGWAHSLCGVAVEILGRWVYDQGSAAEAVGAAVRAASWLVLVRLFPAFAPLFLVRFYERAKYEEKEMERREREEASNEQLPKRNRAQPLLPKGFSLFPLYFSSHLFQLLHLAIVMEHYEEGSHMRRVGSVLYDVACFGIAMSTGFLVQNMMIIVTVPRVKDCYDVMQ